MAEAHAGLVKRGQLAVNHAACEAHDAVHLCARTAPVLRGECKQCEHGYLVLAEALDHDAQILSAGAVALLSREAAALRPAPVAIHDDRDVLRPRVEVQDGRGGDGGLDYHAAVREAPVRSSAPEGAIVPGAVA